MKSWSDVYEKIDELFESAKLLDDPAEKEQTYCKIDALLWVVGDASGKPI